ncbi:hypothetical protein [Bacillus velezensis]|uniref:hypothetical protein n=1 Tax=Bacillus velezensis TaxID=492670 RepID=UPI0035BEE277
MVIIFMASSKEVRLIAGRTHKYNVPNINAEVNVIVEALKNAGLEPNEVSYIEAHGTGTALGIR